MKFSTRVSIKKYTIEVFKKNSLKNKTLSLHIEWKDGRYTEFATALAEKQLDGTFKLKGSQFYKKIPEDKFERLLINIKTELEKPESQEKIVSIFNGK